MAARLSRDVIVGRYGVPRATKPSHNVQNPEPSSGFGCVSETPQGSGVDALGVPGHSKGNALRLCRAGSGHADKGCLVPPSRHFTVVGGATGVGVEVDLDAFAGRPVREADVGEGGNGKDRGGGSHCGCKIS